MVLILVTGGSQIYAGEGVKWKTFKEKDGLFTMKYPSNWIPGKVSDDEFSSVLQMQFTYLSGGRSDVAGVTVFADESVFTNVSDSIDTLSESLDSDSKFKIIQPMECTKYVIKGIDACSIISSYKAKELPGDPTIMELDVAIIDEYGVQYTFIYGATKNLFDDFLPVAEEMIKSFESGNILLPDGESELATDELPELPPLSDAPTIKKL